MRTLDELVKYTSEEAALYKAKEEAKKLDHAEALRLKKKANRDAELALLRGDQQAYTEAVEIEQYNTKRAQALYFDVMAPRFTKEENNAIVAEVHAAESAEVFPLYERLWEMMDEWRDVVQKLNSIHSKRSSCGRFLWNARSTKNTQLDGYEEPAHGIKVSACLDLFKPETPARIEVRQMLKAYRAR